MGAWAFAKVVWAFLKRIPWQAWLVLALCAAIGWHLLQDARTRSALVEARKSEVAAIIAKQLYKAELDRVLADLADAKRAGEAAIKAKRDAEIAAAKRLRERERAWKRLLTQPENRKWAEQKIPAGVLEFLKPPCIKSHANGEFIPCDVPR